MALRVRQIRLEAEDICSYELVDPKGERLPEFKAGAHIDVHLPGGVVRSYSLAGCPGDRTRYVVAVQREEHGRGGSKWFHDQLRVGERLQASVPKNDFGLVETAEDTIFIAGGIGITPILSMIRRLDVLGKRWALHYATRSHAVTAYTAELNALDNGRGRVQHVIGDARTERLNIRRIISAAPQNAHFYCCGSARMIDDFIAAGETRNRDHIHYERFTAASEAATAGGFEVVLARSGRRVPVAVGQTMLDALLDAHVQVPYACSSGICGTCLTPVVQGTPDHRDDFLGEDEKKTGKSIIVCCSGSLSPELVLDL